MRHPVASAVVVGLCLVAQASGQTVTGPELVARVRRSVIPLQWENARGDLETYCSAVVLTPITALVSEHCTDEDHGVRLWLDGVPVVWVSKPSVGMQVARAAIPGRACVPVRVRRTDVREGESVWAVGYAFGDSRSTVTRGIVAHARAFDEDRDQDHLRHETWFDLTLVPGMSGGAIVDDDGQLISLNQGVYSPMLGSALSHGPQLSAVKAIIKRHR